MESERAETYLRQLAEAQLRRARTAGNFMEAVERTHGVAAAFIATDVVSRPAAGEILADLRVAAAARHLAEPVGAQLLRSALQHRRPPGIAPGVRPRLPPLPVRVIRVGRRLRLRADATDADLYLLALVATPVRAWLTAAAYGLPRVPGLTAVDDSGRTYRLGNASGMLYQSRSSAYEGEIGITPAPPPDAAWLEITCGRQTVRIGLAPARAAVEAVTSPLGLTLGERYLQARAEWLLFAPNPARQAPLLAEVTAALTAVGMMPADSVLPGQLAALLAALKVPARSLPSLPGTLPERWASLLASPRPGAPGPGGDGEPGGPPAAAHLTAALPAADDGAVTLAGLITKGGRTTVFGQFTGVPASFRGDAALPPSWWLRDDGGQWHAITMRSWSEDGFTTFEASVLPPVRPAVTGVEVYVIGRTTEVRAALPLTWWARD